MWMVAAPRGRQDALVAQLAEATDSKPVQCEFESHRGHQARGRKLPAIYHLELEHDGRAMWSSILYPDAEGAYRHANAALGLGAAFRLTECPPAETGDWALETGNGMTITTTIGDPQ